MMTADESVTLKSRPPMTVARARLAPTDRSIPRVRITRCWPSATIAMTDVCARMLPIFADFRNTGVVMLTTRIRIARIRRGPPLSRRNASEIAVPPDPRSPLSATSAVLGCSSTFVSHCILKIKIGTVSVVNMFFIA
jgi:hypothetical protein